VNGVAIETLNGAALNEVKRRRHSNWRSPSNLETIRNGEAIKTLKHRRHINFETAKPLKRERRSPQRS